MSEQNKLTNEMSAAGVEALQRYFSFELDNPEVVARAVYEAMTAARPREEPK